LFATSNTLSLRPSASILVIRCWAGRLSAKNLNPARPLIRTAETIEGLLAPTSSIRNARAGTDVTPITILASKPVPGPVPPRTRFGFPLRPMHGPVLSVPTRYPVRKSSARAVQTPAVGVNGGAIEFATVTGRMTTLVVGLALCPEAPVCSSRTSAVNKNWSDG
jgi:hypothetical protein